MGSSQKLLPSLALICGMAANVGSYRATHQAPENVPADLIRINSVNYTIIPEGPSYTETNKEWYLGLTMPCSILGSSLIAAYVTTRRSKNTPS